MTNDERNDYFWQQYYGEVRALDLPKEYKVYDKRIYCTNASCFVKEKCMFWKRNGALSLKAKEIKRDQKGYQRNVWDKRYPKLDYRNASFGFFCEQRGAMPCENYHEETNEK